MHELAAWHIGIKHHVYDNRKFLRNHNAYNDENGSNFLNTYSLNRIYLIFF